MKINKTTLLTLAAVPLTALVIAAAISSREVSAKPIEETPNQQIIRGKYLAVYGGCNDCHTPLKMGSKGPEPDFSRMLSGHPESVKLPPPPKLDNSPWFAATAGMTAWTGPWGISYAPNLTPDNATGLGIWTEEMFIQTMRTGKHMGNGRAILPPMPWQSVGTLSDEDLKALFAYLRSIPAIINHVPGPLAPDGKPMFPE